MAPESLTLFVAFTAGLLSFLSPCVLPLVPSYLTFITGLGLEDVSRSRRTTVTHALLFVLGFSLIFVAMGAGAHGYSLFVEADDLIAAYGATVADITVPEQPR